VGWCSPETGSEPLCNAYLETIFEGLSSTDPVVNGGSRTCVPPDADRAEIIRLVRAHAVASGSADRTNALEGVGTALKGRFPCR
jgi:Rap1a immunity proteins